MQITALRANEAITRMVNRYGGGQNMLKIRLQGTKNDIKWFKKILERNSKIDVMEFSDYFQNKGTNRFYRVYVEINKASDKQKG
jgi:hypothetical protein